MIYSRDAWLLEAIELLREDFSSVGTPIPHNIRVISGRPSIEFIAEHIDDFADDYVIVISSKLEGLEALETLVHELVHTTLDSGAGHGDRFRVVAEAIGLEGEMTSTFAGKSLLSRLRDIELELGAYPQNLGWFLGVFRRFFRIFGFRI